MHPLIVFGIGFVVLFIILALTGRVWNARVRNIEIEQGVEIPKPRSGFLYWLALAGMAAAVAGAVTLLYYFTVWKNLVR
ncbi:hypothetical protein JXM67_11395 [candidate division WOR-3 bacterium]|nr:hypothetical protein [candidate division WOR-3 bacterium]